MKIFLECPNCFNKTVLQSDKVLTSSNVKALLDKKTICESCKKAGLGNIELRIVNFQNENEGRSLSQSKVPTKTSL